MSDGYHGTKCDYVVDNLKEMIIAGVFKPDQKLPNEASLCEQFNVSRITIREAMKKLSMMGLVDICQGKGTFVKPMDLGVFMRPLYQMISFEDVDVEEIYDARTSIESGTAELAALRRTDKDLYRLEQILQELKNAITQESAEEIARWDYQFHKEIAKCSGNTILQACQEAVAEIDKTMTVRLSKTLALLKNCYGEHNDIYKAIKQQNPIAAAEAVRVHTMNSKLLMKE